MPPSKPFSPSKLNEFLAKIGEEVVDSVTDSDGTEVITREEKLARMLYQKAEGWTEKKLVRDKMGNEEWQEVYHPPENWALQYIFDRRLGKAATAQQEQTNHRAQVGTRVRELAKTSLDNISQRSAAPPPPP